MDLKDIEKSLDLLKQSVVPYEICVTLVDELHNQENIEELGEWLQGVDTVILQPFEDSETTIDHSLHRPSFEVVLKYKNIFEKYVKHVKIRGDQA